jgi:hypothetical protein
MTLTETKSDPSAIRAFVVELAASLGDQWQAAELDDREWTQRQLSDGNAVLWVITPGTYGTDEDHLEVRAALLGPRWPAHKHALEIDQEQPKLLLRVTSRASPKRVAHLVRQHMLPSLVPYLAYLDGPAREQLAERKRTELMVEALSALDVVWVPPTADDPGTHGQWSGARLAVRVDLESGSVTATIRSLTVPETLELVAAIKVIDRQTETKAVEIETKPAGIETKAAEMKPETTPVEASQKDE